MKLISRIKISRFRSIKDIELTNIEDFTVLAGLNNSGKSNILRALNLFFTNYTDDNETELNFEEDFYRLESKKHKKKEIIVSVSFSIPEHFRFRKGLDNVQGLITISELTITKKWERMELFIPYPKYYLNNSNEPLNATDEQKIDQFLNLISFRYIPNRILPLDSITKEHTNLRNALIRRFGKKDLSHTQVFDAIKKSSSGLIKKMSQDFIRSFPTANEVLLKTPDSWAEMIFALGYRITENEFEFDDILQGSGIQSLLMFNTLSLIDRDYFQKFGWRQAAIWAVEEPESSLHSTLEARMASYLSEIAKEHDGRLQIFATTHSDLMMQYSDSVALVKKEKGTTQLSLYKDKKEILQLSASAGISRWVDPILHYPLEPVIIFDGKFDYDFVLEAYKLIRPKIKFKITYLGELLGLPGRGGSDTVNYIRARRQEIKSRQKFSPVIVVLDCESKNAKEFEKLFDPEDPFKVMIWPKSDCNPMIGSTFRGIERYFSNRIIEESIQNGAQIGKTPMGIYMYSPDEKENVKKKCNEIVNKGLESGDLIYVNNFLQKITDFISSLQK